MGANQGKQEVGSHLLAVCTEARKEITMGQQGWSSCVDCRLKKPVKVHRFNLANEKNLEYRTLQKAPLQPSPLHNPSGGGPASHGTKKRKGTLKGR